MVDEEEIHMEVSSFGGTPMAMEIPISNPIPQSPGMVERGLDGWTMLNT